MQSLHLIIGKCAIENGQSTKTANRRFLEHRSDGVTRTDREIRAPDLSAVMFARIELKDPPAMVVRIHPTVFSFGAFMREVAIGPLV